MAIYRSAYSITSSSIKGGRNNQEDAFIIRQHFDQTSNQHFTYIGVFDGHGGADASEYAKNRLMSNIIKHKGFWSKCDERIVQAIADGFKETQNSMWKMRRTWPNFGRFQTPGTTASIGFIMNDKLYTGHVGDSRIFVGFQGENKDEWDAILVSKRHKVDEPEELARIKESGGNFYVDQQSEKLRVGISDNGIIYSVRISRSLGDFWSLNESTGEFILSSKPACCVVPIDLKVFRCIIFATNGMTMSPYKSVNVVRILDKNLRGQYEHCTVNPSSLLTDLSAERFHENSIPPDNITVVCMIFNTEDN